MSVENPVMAENITGRCLCGDVSVTVGRHRAEVGACHCSRCRRWTGSALFAFSAEVDEVEVTGPVRIWKHKIAERASCGTCGTLLWMRSHGKAYEFQVGLFDAARDYPLISEIYSDCAFASVSLAGEHRRATLAEYEAKHPIVEGAP